MRLSLIIELLIIFLLLAFAASRVIDPGDNNDYPRKLSSTSNTSQRQTAVVDGNSAAPGAPAAAEPPVAAETSAAAENPVAAEQKPAASTNATRANETTTEEPPTEAPQAADEETSQQAEAVAAVQEEQQQPTSAKPTTPKPASPSTEATTSTTPPPQRACTCEELTCSCCREFPRLPLLRGPACAKLTYHDEDEMSLALTFGRRVLHNTTIKGTRPEPVCMNMPGGVTQFCARIYGITKRGQADKYFRACLGFEIRAFGDVESGLRVSCFRFGPQGLGLEPPPPLPPDPVPPVASLGDYDFVVGDYEDDVEEDENQEAGGQNEGGKPQDSESQGGFFSDLFGDDDDAKPGNDDDDIFDFDIFRDAPKPSQQGQQTVKRPGTGKLSFYSSNTALDSDDSHNGSSQSTVQVVDGSVPERTPSQQDEEGQTQEPLASANSTDMDTEDHTESQADNEYEKRNNLINEGIPETKDINREIHTAHSSETEEYEEDDYVEETNDDGSSSKVMVLPLDQEDGSDEEQLGSENIPKY